MTMKKALQMGGITAAFAFGAAVATGHGVAAADTGDAASSAGGSASSSSSDASDKTDKADKPATDDTTKTDTTDEADTSSATSETETETETDTEAETEAEAEEIVEEAVSTTDEPAAEASAAADQGPQRSSNAHASASSAVTVSAATAAESDDTPTSAAPEVSLPAAESGSATIQSAVTAAPTATTPPAPVTPAAMIAAAAPASVIPAKLPTNPFFEAVNAFVAAYIRQIQRTFFNQTPQAAPVQRSQSATGVVTGTIGATDRDGDPLTYTVTTEPTRGTVVVAADGTYTYTPATALAASGGTDAFTVKVAEANAAEHIHGLFGLFDRSFGSTVTTSVPVTVTAVAVVNRAPAAGTPPFTTTSTDATTGVVTGTVNVTDPDGTPLIYVVSTAPNAALGSATVDATGTFTFTPTGAARLAAAGSGSSSARYVITASDGQLTTAVTVVSAITPAEAAVTGTITVPNNPTRVVIAPSGGLTVYSNPLYPGLSVADSADPGTVRNIDLDVSPDVVEVTPDGEYIVVASYADASLNIVRPSDGLVIATPIVIDGSVEISANLTDVAVADDGALTVLELSSNSVVGRTSGRFSSIQISAKDQVAAYNRDSGALDFFVRPRASSQRLAAGDVGAAAVPELERVVSINLGGRPTATRYNLDGTRLYATVAGAGDDAGRLFVVDTSAAVPTVIGDVDLGRGASELAVSGDDSRGYVANSGDGTLSVIDLQDRSVVDTVTLGPVGSLAVSADGNTVLATNPAGAAVSVIGSIFDSPITVSDPAFSIDATDSSTGAVTGLVNVFDIDTGVDFTLENGPGPDGTVTVDTATGRFTFTPTLAAREAAALTLGEDPVLFTIVGSNGISAIPVDVTAFIAPVATVDIPVATSTGGARSKAPIRPGRVPGRTSALTR